MKAASTHSNNEAERHGLTLHRNTGPTLAKYKELETNSKTSSKTTEEPGKCCLTKETDTNREVKQKAEVYREGTRDWKYLTNNIGNDRKQSIRKIKQSKKRGKKVRRQSG